MPKSLKGANCTGDKDYSSEGTPLLYPKNFPLMFSKIFPLHGGYKHLLKENELFRLGGGAPFDYAFVGLLRSGMALVRSWPSIGSWNQSSHSLRLGLAVNRERLLVIPCCLLRLGMASISHGLRFWLDLVQMYLLILLFCLGSQHGSPRICFMSPSSCFFRLRY